jgi:aryl-alcohol dehydrogenase-like predicted oxidoreductase
LEEATRLIADCLDLGLNLIDTAAAYGSSEEFLGEALRGQRHRVFLATKFGETWSTDEGSKYDYSPTGIRRSIENSLRKLQTDYVDLLQVHSAKREMLERGEVLETMMDLRAEGKARFLGFSADVETARLGLAQGGWDVVQIPYSILSPEAQDNLFEEAGNAGVGILLMRSLAGGKLTAKFRHINDQHVREALQELLRWTDPAGDPEGLSSLALRYALTPPQVSSVLLGTRRSTAVALGRFAAQQGPLNSEIVGRINKTIRDRGIHVW